MTSPGRLLGVAAAAAAWAAAALAGCGRTAAARADPSPRAAFAFVLSGGRVQAHEIDPGSGALRPRGAPGPACAALGVDPSGRWLLCSHGASAAALRIGDDGSLAPQQGAVRGRAPWAAPPEIEVDPAGRFLWGIGPEEGAPTVWAAAVDAARGAVRLVEREPVGWRPADLQRAGSFLYVANRGSGDVWGYAVDALSGGLRALGRMAQLDSPSGLAADPDGRFLYVAGRAIFAFRRGDDGRLTPLGRVAGGDAVVVARPVEWAASCTPILSSWPSWPSARSRFPPTPPPPCGSGAR